MPSSTSSSNSHERAPEIPLLPAWGGALVALVALLGGWEMFWRTQGHTPSSVRDGMALWSAQRAALLKCEAPVALLGASRMQLGFDLETWRELAPGREAKMLAIDGSSPVVALRDLAEDEAFSGLVIVSLSEELLEPWRWPDQAAHVKFYRQQYRIGTIIEGALDTWMESRLVLLNSSSVNPRLVFSLLLKERRLPRHYLHTFATRERDADYLGQTEAWRVKNRKWREVGGRKTLEMREVSTPAEWRGYLDRLARDVERIEARGGQVVFVRLPITGGYREMMAEYYPRQAYWDTLAERFGDRAIHYEDVPALAELECPDSSHIDMRDKPVLTRALFEEMKRRSLL